MLSQNLDRYALLTDEISPQKLENPRKYTMQGPTSGKTQQSFFRDKYNSIKDKRSNTFTTITEKINSPLKEYGEKGALNS